jgi:ketosteroid isomerase-like protein
MNPTTMNATELAQVTADPSGKAVLEFLSVLETKDVNQLLVLWHDDGMIEFPFSHKGIPGLPHPQICGKEAIYATFQNVAKVKDLTFKEITVFPMKDPDYVYVESLCDITQLDLNINYTNRYAFLCYVPEGKIMLVREYFHALIRHNFEAGVF